MLKPLPIPRELIEAIKEYTCFIIIGHKDPDSDSLNSQLALSSLLTHLGKTTHLVSTGPFTRHEIIDYEQLFSAHIPEEVDPEHTMVIVVDCSSADRIGYLAEEIAGLTIAVIDHHAAGQNFGDISFIDPNAVSVTYLVFQLFNEFSVPLTEQDAHRLLFGLATDTGYFRHIDPYRGEVFTTIAALVEAGASPREIYQSMFGKRSFASRKLLGLLLARMEQYFDGRMLVTWETYEETRQYGEINRDPETLYAQMMSIHDCEIILYIRQDHEDGSCTVGFRAHGNSPINVGAIAAEFGGGGHKKAAGATISNDIPTIITMMKERFTKEFHE